MMTSSQAARRCCRAIHRIAALACAAVATLTLTVGIVPLAQAQACDPSKSCCANPGGGSPGCGGSSSPASPGRSTPIDLGVGNPINVITGNKYQREEDLPALPGVLGLEIVRHYNSVASGLDSKVGTFGRGWRLSYDTELIVKDAQTLEVALADGSALAFAKADTTAAGVSTWSSLQPGQGRITSRKVARGVEYTWRWGSAAGAAGAGRELLFDAKGKLLQISAPTGEFVTLQRDPQGWLVQVTDPQGRTLHLNYLDKAQAQSDRNGTQRFRGVRSIDSPVGRYAYGYNDQGALTPEAVKAQLQARRIDAVELLANLVQVSLPTHYDADQKAHPYANRGVSSSSVNRLYHYEDPAHPTLLTGITVSGQGSDGQQMLQRISTYAYDAYGRANLSVRGEPARLEASADGRPVEPRRLAAGTGAEQVTLQWPRAGEVVLTNALGQETRYRTARIAGQDRLLQASGSGCARCAPVNMRYAYDAQGRLLETTRITLDGVPIEGQRMEVDAQGRTLKLSRVPYIEGKAQPAQWVTRYEYPSNPEQAGPTLIARPSVIQDKEHLIRFAYNDAGQTTSIAETGFSPVDEKGAANTTALVRLTTLRYQSINGRSVLAEIDRPLPNGPKGTPEDSDITRVRYDGSANHVVETIQPLGGVAKLIYDPTGRIVERTGEDGLTERLSYDTLGRVNRLERAGTRLELAYGATGRVTKVEDALGQRLSLRYDAAGHLLELRDPQGHRISWAYTPEGGLLELQLLNPDGSVSQRRPADPPIDTPTLAAQLELAPQPELSEQDSEGRNTTYQNDDFGRRVVQISPVTGRSTLRYDAADRLIAKIASDGGQTLIDRDTLGRAVRVQATGEDARIEWGRHNRPVRVTYREGEERFDYDANARLALHTRLIDGKSFSTRYEYDALGRTTRKTGPDGQTLGYRYNGSQHAKPGVLAGIVREGVIDTPIISELNTASERFAERGFTHGNGLSHARLLDEQGRPLRVGSKAAGQSQLQWDRSAEPTVSYRAAALGQQLAPDVARSMQMRVSFTLPQLGASPRSANPLTALMDPSRPLQRHDSRGRLIEDDQRVYSWDGMDRLIDVQAKGTAGPTPVAHYRYNLFGERIAKVVYSQGKQGTTSYFFYDGNELTAEADGSGQVVRDYVYIEHRPVAMLEGRAVLAIHTDHRLAPMAVTDKDRNVVWQARLGDNGEAAVAQGSSIDMPLRGSNQYFDPETGLHYNTHRYLDAKTGRYISPDPMGLAAGPNLYQFALGQPHRFVDPLGLAPITTDADVPKAAFADKLAYAFNRVGDSIGGDVGQALKDLVSPTALATTAAIFGVWAIAQATPVGWAADILMLGIGYFMLGEAIADVLEAFIDVAQRLNSAKCLSDLDVAGGRLSKTLAAVTVNVGVAAATAGAPKVAGIIRQLLKDAPVGKAIPAPKIPAVPRLATLNSLTGRQLFGPKLTRIGTQVNDGKLGEQLAAQMLEWLTGGKFRGIQNASGHGPDLIRINTVTKTIEHVEAKSSQIGKPGWPAGNATTRFNDWLAQAATGKINGQKISAADEAYARDVLNKLTNEGYTLDNKVMQVTIPKPGATGAPIAELFNW